MAKTMKIFYDSNALPYKDSALQVHYPIVGQSFTGGSFVDTIRFYVGEIGGIVSTTWVAVAKLPNGKKVYKVLTGSYETIDEIDYPYVDLPITSELTQLNGDIYISLNGYQGGADVSFDSTTGLYTISGNPIIQATGSIKYTIAYAPTMPSGYNQVATISVQEALALISDKLAINDGIVVVPNHSAENANNYENGQIIYCKTTNLLYEKLNGSWQLIAYPSVSLSTAYVDANTYNLTITLKGKDNTTLATSTINLADYLATKTYVSNYAYSKDYVDTELAKKVDKTTTINGYALSSNVNLTKSDVGLGNVDNVKQYPYTSGVNLDNKIDTEIANRKELAGHSIDMTIDSNFDLVIKLLNANGLVISQDDVDLPLESIVVSATYYNTYTYQGVTYEKVIVIVLATTNVPTIVPVGDLVSGLVSTDELATALAGYYTKAQTDSLLSGKADKSTTLSGYGITNAYTKTETDDLLDKKANVDGNYPTLTSGLADNLTPYGEDSGATQENPFISNGTGTNNNTEIVTVGDYGLLKEKQGNTLVVNQLADVITLSSNGGLTYTGGHNGYLKIEGTANGSWNRVLFSDLNTLHKYLVFALKPFPEGFSFGSSYSSSQRQFHLVSNSSYEWIYHTEGTNMNDWESYIKLIDLTQMFNGDIPQNLLDNPSHFSWYYNGDLSYNTGSLENASGVKLVSTGRQQWDEEWELGAYDTTTGLSVGGQQIRSKNNSLIRVSPNTQYYCYNSGGGDIWCFFYDNNKTLITGYRTGTTYSGNASQISNSTFSTPSNCSYIKFYVTSSYGTTYKNDITISLYYTPEQGGEGYDKYYQYEEPYVVDTGSEVLRKVGSVNDYKEPNGTIHRVVDSYTFTGEEIWATLGENGAKSCEVISSLINGASGNEIANVLCSTLTPETFNNVYYGNNTNGIAITSTGKIVVNETQVSNITGKTIYYELLTPTTKQGTPFAENLPINDYGMLYWLDSSDNLVGIPQGAKIFYPTNYKGFVDDMYSRVDGDSSAYVVQSELSAEETARSNQDTILQNAIGGTLRQCLCVKESLDFDNTACIDLENQNWSQFDDSGTTRFRFSLVDLNSVAGSTKYICSSYKSATSRNIADAISRYNSSDTGTFLYFTSASTTTLDQLKAKMKGVLLAYEKA